MKVREAQEEGAKAIARAGHEVIGMLSAARAKHASNTSFHYDHQMTIVSNRLSTKPSPNRLQFGPPPPALTPWQIAAQQAQDAEEDGDEAETPRQPPPQPPPQPQPHQQRPAQMPAALLPPPQPPPPPAVHPAEPEPGVAAQSIISPSASDCTISGAESFTETVTVAVVEPPPELEAGVGLCGLEEETGAEEGDDGAGACLSVPGEVGAGSDQLLPTLLPPLSLRAASVSASGAGFSSSRNGQNHIARALGGGGSSQGGRSSGGGSAGSATGSRRAGRGEWTTYVRVGPPPPGSSPQHTMRRALSRKASRKLAASGSGASGASKLGSSKGGGGMGRLGGFAAVAALHDDAAHHDMPAALGPLRREDVMALPDISGLGGGSSGGAERGGSVAASPGGAVAGGPSRGGLLGLVPAGGVAGASGGASPVPGGSAAAAASASAVAAAAGAGLGSPVQRRFSYSSNGAIGAGGSGGGSATTGQALRPTPLQPAGAPESPTTSDAVRSSGSFVSPASFASASGVAAAAANGMGSPLRVSITAGAGAGNGAGGGAVPYAVPHAVPHRMFAATAGGGRRPLSITTSGAVALAQSTGPYVIPPTPNGGPAPAVPGGGIPGVTSRSGQAHASQSPPLLASQSSQSLVSAAARSAASSASAKGGGAVGRAASGPQ